MRYQVTLHVETVCLLSKRKPDTTVKIWIDMEDYRRSGRMKSRDNALLSMKIVYGTEVKKLLKKNCKRLWKKLWTYISGRRFEAVYREESK